MTGPRAPALLVETVWHRAPDPTADDRTLGEALALARSNEVEGRFARAYPERLAPEVREIAGRTAAFRRNLREAAGRLEDAGVPAVLIKADPDEDFEYGNFDLVVGGDSWEDAVRALEPWSVRRTAHPAERTKLLLHPAGGPAAHLHREVSWFDVPVIPTERLQARAVRREGESWSLPAPVDALRIALAHAAFQNLAFTLAELETLRRLLATELVEQALLEAEAEGWRRGFSRSLRTAAAAMRRLDAREPVRLPAPLSAWSSIAIGLEHGAGLWRSGSRLRAGRELALRFPLVAAKKMRAARA